MVTKHIALSPLKWQPVVIKLSSVWLHPSRMWLSPCLDCLWCLIHKNSEFWIWHGQHFFSIVSERCGRWGHTQQPWLTLQYPSSSPSPDSMGYLLHKPTNQRILLMNITHNQTHCCSSIINIKDSWQNKNIFAMKLSRMLSCDHVFVFYTDRIE